MSNKSKNNKTEEKLALLSDSESSDNEAQPSQSNLKINKRYADKFQRTAEYKELQRAKELLADASESDSEDNEDEDEDAELLSPDLDLKIIQTINSLKKKDPRIYDKETKWFSEQEDDEDDDEEDEEEDKESNKKKKYKDILREQLLTKGADNISDEEDDDGNNQISQSLRKSQLIYDREQENIRKAFLQAAQTNDSNDEQDDEDNLLQVKEKSKAQQEAEEKELQQALLEMKTLETKQLQNQETQEKEKENTDFLFAYLEKKLWKQPIDEYTVDVDNYDEEEQELDQLDKFESKYNFRFEEMLDQREQQPNDREEDQGDAIRLGLLHGNVQVIGHSRQVADSLRRKDDKRKIEREKKLERKEKEKRQKEEEIKRLKNLKKQELKQRLNKIGEIGGLKSLGIIDEDFLDEDWDPEKHEKLMQQEFGDEYYNDAEDQLDLEGGDQWAQEYLDDENYEEPAMEVDQEETEETEESKGKKSKKGGKKDVNTAETKALVSSMMDEYYNLDYEDIVAGMPTRFKYRQVEPEDYGLDTEDILAADDSDLNRFVSLKYLATYNPKKWSKSDQDVAKRRKKLRSKIRETKDQLEELLAPKEQPTKKTTATTAESNQDNGEKKKRKRRKNKPSNEEEAQGEGEDEGEEQSPQPEAQEEPNEPEVDSKPKENKSNKPSKQSHKKQKKSHSKEKPAKLQSLESKRMNLYA